MKETEAEVFLRLKFGTMGNLQKAFRNAVGTSGYTAEVTNTAIREALKIWMEQGCPETIEIPENRASIFLCLKHGSVKGAYEYWIRHGLAAERNFCEYELNIIKDYVVPPRG